MNWKRPFQAVGRGTKALTQMVFRRYSWRTWGLPGSRRDWESEVGDGLRSSVVASPLLWIARNFPEAPPALWRQMDNGQEEQEGRHDLLRLLQRPNPYYSGALLWSATVTEYNALGNAAWLKIRDRGGRVRELWWTPWALLDPKGDEHNFITHYEYRPSGVAIPLEPEDVVHFRFGMDEEDPRQGCSPLRSVLREVFTDDEASNFTAALLKNMGIPGLVVSPDGDQQPGPDDVKAVKSYVRQNFSGDRRGEPLVMSGPTKVSQFGFSPEELSLKELRRVPEERVSGALGVPAIVAGLGAGLDRSTFANYGEAREAAYEENIVPTQRVLAEEVRFQLLPDFEEDPWGWRFGFDLKNVRVLQEDRNKQTERLDIGVRGGWVRVAEARRAVDLDVDPGDEVYLRPLSTVEVEPGDRRTDEPPPDEPPPPGPKPEPETAPPPDEGKMAALHKGHTRAQIALQAALDRDGIVLSALLAGELEESFLELGAKAEEAFLLLSPNLSANTNGATKAEDDGLVKRVVEALHLGTWVKDHLGAKFKVHYRRTAAKTVDTINAVLDLGVNLSDPAEKEIVATGGKRVGLVDVEKATKDAIFRALADARENGEGPIEAARRIRSQVPAGRYVNAGSGYRAQLIARTETKFAQNVSSLQAYKESPHIESVTAFDARAGNSDPECISRDGQTFTLDEADGELASEHPNGTLSFAPNVADRLETTA